MRHPRVLTLSDPLDLLRAIPHVMGFHPAHSAVVLWSQGARIVLVQRVDLPCLRTVDSREWIEAVWAPAESVAADCAIVVMYVEHLEIVDEYVPLFQGLLGSAPVRINGLLASAPEGWLDSSGTPHDWGSADATADRSVQDFFGSEPLIAREALSLAPVAPIRAPSSRAPGRAVRRRALALLEACEGSTPSDAEVAIIARGLRDSSCRDRAIELILVHHSGTIARVWDGIVIRMPRGWGAPLASIAALGHWIGGDGARSNVALERALADDPHYALALLVEQLVAGAVHPERVRSWLLEMRPADAAAS